MDNSGFVIINAEGERILCDCNLPIIAEELTVPDGVTIIDGKAFTAVLDIMLPPHDILKKVVLPDSVKRIGDDAFNGAVSLQQVVLPNGLEAIGDFAFSGCTMLRDIYLPESLTSLGELLFYNCSNLTIHGVSGSAAELYARQHGFLFVDEEKKTQK